MRHLGVHTMCCTVYLVCTHCEAEMTNNPQVPVVKHLLEQAERNAHLKETFTKSQSSKYVYFPFINKIEQKSSKSFQQKIFLPLWQVKKKYSEIEDTLKAVEFLFFKFSNTSDLEQSCFQDHLPLQGRGSLGLQAAASCLRTGYKPGWEPEHGLPLKTLPFPAKSRSTKMLPQIANKHFSGLGLQKANS